VTAPAGASSPSVGLLAIGKSIDQGALFVASLVVAGALGPDRFAPVAALLVASSMSVQLSDLGLGFALLASPLRTPVPGRTLRRVRVVGASLLVVAAVVSLALGSPVAVLAGAIWVVTAEAYVRKAAVLRTGGAARVVRAEVGGSIVVAVAALAAAVATSAGVFLVGLLGKHVLEVALLGRFPALDREGSLPSATAWLGQAATYAASNADYLVIGLVLPPEVFSVYVLAFRMVSALPALIGGSLMQRSFVDLAASEEPEAPRRLHARIPQTVARLAVAGVVLGVGAAVGGRVVLGSSWADLVPVALALAVAVPFRLALGSIVAVALSAGLGAEVLTGEAVRLVLVAALCAIGASVSVEAAAVGTALATAVGVGRLHHRVGRRLSDAPVQPTRS
jgi:O-antigen/teichoic acid export membrane protein